MDLRLLHTRRGKARFNPRKRYGNTEGGTEQVRLESSKAPAKVRSSRSLGSNLGMCCNVVYPAGLGVKSLIDIKKTGTEEEEGQREANV